MSKLLTKKTAVYRTPTGWHLVAYIGEYKDSTQGSVYYGPFKTREVARLAKVRLDSFNAVLAQFSITETK